MVKAWSRGLKRRPAPGRHVLELDLRSLAVTRFVFGLALLIDIGIRTYDLTRFYSDDGVLPRATLLEAGWNPYFFSLQMTNGRPGFLLVLATIQAVAAVCLLLGYRTRLATLASWVLLLSIHNRNPWLLNGGDVYFRMILFWMLFLPWGQVWSWDHRNGQSDVRWWTGQLTADCRGLRTPATLAVLLQVCLLYWFAAIPKTHPSWVADFSAINVSLHADHIVGSNGIWFREIFSNWLPVLTRATLEWEFWGPFLFWFPFDRGQVRTIAAFGFMAMHLGFEVTLQLGMFPLFCICALFVLLPSWFWEVPARRLTEMIDRYLPRENLHPPGGTQHPKRWQRILRDSLLGFLILYVLAWNFNNENLLRWFRFPASWNGIGYALRMDQRWNMFSPSPPYQDGWWVIEATRRSGKTFDALNAAQPVSWEKPKDVSGAYLNQRRRRWMMELRSTNSEALLNSTCGYLAAQLNGPERSLHEVSKLDLYYVLEMTSYEGVELPPKRLHIYSYQVFSGRTLKVYDFTEEEKKERKEREKDGPDS